MEQRIFKLLGWFPPLVYELVRYELAIPRSGIRPIDLISRVSCPVLIIAGSKDLYTPVSETQKMYRNASESKDLWVVEGAGHVDLYRYAKLEYEKRIFNSTKNTKEKSNESLIRNKKGADRMQLDYELTIEDIVNFNLYHFRNSKTFKNKRILFRWIIPIWVILVHVYLNFDQSNGTILLYNIPIFLFGALWYFFYNRLYFWRVGVNLNKMLREGRNNGMIGKQKITLTDDSLNVETEFHSSRFKLGSINQIVETTEYIFLYLTSMSALVIPQPAFRNSKKDEFLEKVRIFVM